MTQAPDAPDPLVSSPFKQKQGTGVPLQHGRQKSLDKANTFEVGPTVNKLRQTASDMDPAISLFVAQPPQRKKTSVAFGRGSA